MSVFLVKLNDQHIYIEQSPLKKDDEKSSSKQLSTDQTDGLSNIPVCSNERFFVLFDGMIYNKESLQRKLNEYVNVDTLTTEQLIAALFNEYGPSLFSLLRGKFVILIWDSFHHILYGVRDQFGIKPLFFKNNEQGYVIANVKKYITLNYDLSINLEALQHYFSFQYVPQPLSLSSGLQQLKPGHYFIKERHKQLIIERYFHPICQPNYSLDKHDIISDIQEKLWEAVNDGLPPDRAIGSFLSGGIDSSLIASIAQKIRPDLTAISVGFEDLSYSEIDIAKQTANIIGVNHVTHVITAKEFINTVPKVIQHMAEPIADPSCIPFYIAAREAKKHVDIVLSGEGADEIFAGYNIYREHESLKYITRLPNAFLQAFKHLATFIPDGVKGKSFLERATTPLHERYIGNAKIFEEDEIMHLLTTYNSDHSYKQWTEPLYNNVLESHPVEQMQYIDLNLWLLGNILPKANQLTAAHGLDIRMPFLDPALFQVAQHIPVSFKVANGMTKTILREAAKKWAPEHVIRQRKLGFPVPLQQWLKHDHDVYEWALNIIHTSRTDHLIKKQYVLQLLHEHRKSNRNHCRKLWTILTFMIWYEMFMNTTMKNTEDILATVTN